MSVFTKYDSELSISYHAQASDLLGKSYWVVLKPFSFYLNEDNSKFANIPAGVLTDGASTPRFFWGLIPPWGRYGQAAVLHDYLCETGIVNESHCQHHIERECVDRIFNEAMKVLGVPKWKRRAMYLAVCLFRIVTGAKTPTIKPFKQAIESEICQSMCRNDSFRLSEEQLQRLSGHVYS